MTNSIRRITNVVLSFILMAGIFLMTGTGADVSAATTALPTLTEVVSVALDDCAGVYVVCDGDADGVLFYLYNNNTQKYALYKNVEMGCTANDDAVPYAIGGLEKNRIYKFKAVAYTKENGKIIKGKKGRIFTIKTLPAALPDAGDFWTPDKDVIDVNLKKGFDLGYIDSNGAEEVQGLAHGVYAASVIYDQSVGEKYDSYIRAMRSAGYTVKRIAKKSINVDEYTILIEQYSVSYKGKRAATLCKVVMDMEDQQGGILMFSSGSKFNVVNAKERTADSIVAEVNAANAKLMFCNAAVFQTKMEVAGKKIPDGVYFVSFDDVPEEHPQDPKDVEKALQYYTGEKAPGKYCVVVYKDNNVQLVAFGEDESIMRQIAGMKDIDQEVLESIAEKYPIGYYPM